MYCLTFSLYGQDKIGNYVSNGSFEEVVQGSLPPIVKSWSAIDSLSYFGKLLTKNLPPYNVPLNSFGYQWPRNGNNYLIHAVFYIDGPVRTRGYPRNKLKEPLISGVNYCVKMNLCLSNNSTHATDDIGIYFTDSSLDTITKCNIPLTYLMPQINNLNGNYINDTLNWITVSGTFIATGLEENMVIGNFKSDSLTDTVLVNPSLLPTIGIDLYLDAISCIKIDLSAYAGPDKSIIPGDSVYIGRESDFAIDSGCVWFKLPNITTAIDTTSGIWVKPSTTSTYVVRQTLECSSEKWDTVVVHVDLTGVKEFSYLEKSFKVYPVPTSNEIYLTLDDDLINFIEPKLVDKEYFIEIYNKLGMNVYREVFNIEQNKIEISTRDFNDGIYTVKLLSKEHFILTRKFIVIQ